jgi:succinate dehydrogenase / fumarate reductase cytochrome b subunit
VASLATDIRSTKDVVVSILRYRGGVGQWAWAIHRAAGLGVLLFLLLHIFDIFLAFFPSTFSDLIFLYKGPISRILEVLLLFGLLYHALNGTRVILGDFIPSLASLKNSQRLLAVQILLFLVLFIAGGFEMMYALPQEPFKQNALIAGGTVAAILAIPIIAVLFGQFAPPAVFPSGDVSGGNYKEAVSKLAARRSARPRSRADYNIWLFMRISGALVIVLALVHFFIMHFVIRVDEMSIKTIIDRWNDPANPLMSMFWRVYDFALLAFAFTHGIYGTLSVADDYFHAPGWRGLIRGLLYLLWVGLMVLGISVIIFFGGK